MYGISTGFGALVSNTVAPELQRHLQINLLRSHAAGTGPELPIAVVRGAIAIRANGLLLGHSGVRPVVVQRLAALLNGGYIPRVPRTGSLGASGDLAPSAHAFLPLIGEGQAYDPDGALVSGAEALAALGLEPLELESKEGLALINGTHFMSAIGALLTVRVGRLLDAIDLVTAATIDALRGALPAFDARVHRLRPLAGQSTSAANISLALRGSSRIAGPGSSRLQDAYSLRCAAQVHGAAREALRFFAELVVADLNAVTDNPLVFDDPPEVISAGNFHGQALAVAFDTLRLALADLGSISERRTFRLLSPSLNGRLPEFLTTDAGTSSGYMVVQYTAAASGRRAPGARTSGQRRQHPHLRQPGGPRVDGDDRGADGARFSRAPRAGGRQRAPVRLSGPGLRSWDARRDGPVPARRGAGGGHAADARSAPRRRPGGRAAAD